MSSIKVAIGQINPTVGDIQANIDKILGYIDRAKGESAELIIFPELAIVGYPPRDLLLKPSFIEKAQWGLEQLTLNMPDGIYAIVGCIQKNTSSRGKPCYNSAAVIKRGRIISIHHKSLLPTYDVFDEQRYFEPGPIISLSRILGVNFGISICEDLWTVQNVLGRVLYYKDPIEVLASAGAEIFVNIAASPFVIDKPAIRTRLLSEHAKRYQIPLIYVNQVGGNDELIFDGGSCLVDRRGNVVSRAKSFEEDLLIVDIDLKEMDLCEGSFRKEPLYEGVESVYRALVLGLRDYVDKSGFTKGVVVGLSGGIDSSVVAAIAVEALGKDKVHGVAMPSCYNSPASLEDAGELASRLGIDFKVISIEPIRLAFEGQLRPIFDSLPADVTEENIQARIRGTLLMALSNKFGWLVLSTGNKSELAMGYCTLYGDMVGGLAVISDVPKTMVYEIARFINSSAGKDIIPRRILTKPPSAELRPNQTDQDTLPPYDILDKILKLYIEEELPAEEIIEKGFSADVVRYVITTVDKNEYKRKQAPIGLKVTSRAFGLGRRMPIVQRFKQFD